MKEFLKNVPENVQVIDPVGYRAMLELERNADLIITDSGGVQREAYIFQKRCVLLRNTNEIPELKSGKKGLLGNEDAYKKVVKILCSII
jgi:UDP-N-acetylglucosamine 2-epimerase